MTALFCCLALVALNSDLKPLPEEEQLVQSEEVALQFCRLEVAEVGLVGWTKTTVQRVQMEGATHYFVHREAELLDFEALGFITMESRGLYDADFYLVRERRLEQPLGGDTKPLELEWGDEGFRWRKGRGRWTAGASEVRPTVETDVPLLVHGLSLTTPWAGQVFDNKTLELQAQTLQAGKETRLDDQAVMTFEVKGPTPMRHRLDKDGGYVESQLAELRMVGVDADKDPGIGLREDLAASASFQRAIDRKFRASWTEKKGTFSNAVLGMSLKLPKNWTRDKLPESSVGHFRANDAEFDAYLNLRVVVLGTGYTFDEWTAGVVDDFAGIAVDGTVKAKKKSFAKQNAMSFEFTQDGKWIFDATAYAWTHGGFGFLLIGGTLEEAPKKLHKETRGILKSVKFSR